MRADLDIAVGHAVAQEGQTGQVDEHLGHGGAEPAGDVVLLHRHDRLGLAGGGGDLLPVERADRVHVDDADGGAGLFERGGGVERGAHLASRRDEGEVGALAQADGLADGEVGDGVVDHRIAAPTQADIHRARMVGRSAQHGAQVVGVGGADDGQVGHAAQHPEVFERVVGRAVEAHGHSGMGADHAHRHLRIGAVGADLFGAEYRGEAGEGGDIGHHPAGGHAGGGGDHVLLGDPEVEEAVGMRGLEVVGAVGGGQVGGGDDDAGIGLRHLGQLLAQHEGGHAGLGGAANGSGVLEDGLAFGGAAEDLGFVLHFGGHSAGSGT